MGKSLMEPRVASEIDKYCDFFIKPNLGKPMSLQSLALATNNVISEMIFGGRSDYGDEKFHNLIRCVERTVKAVLIAGITKNLPLVHLFKFSGIQEVEEANGPLQAEMQHRLETSKANFNSSNVKDMFDHFISYQKSHEGAQSSIAFGGKN